MILTSPMVHYEKRFVQRRHSLQCKTTSLWAHNRHSPQESLTSTLYKTR